MESFEQGYRLGSDDLVLNLYARYYNSQPYMDFPFTPFWIRYDVGFIHQVTNQFMPIGCKKRIPDIINTGRVKPNFIIGDDWKIGVYEIKWYYTVTETSDIQMTSVQFSVSSNGVSSPSIALENHSDINAYMIIY
jgi:hypothetical protein